MRANNLLGAVAAGVLFLMTGCGFFPPNSSTTTVATSTSGDYVYVVNQTTNTISQFSVGSSVLTAISGSPVSLASTIGPASADTVAVTRQNSFVYVGGQGGIACFSIGTGGALTAVSAGSFSTTGKVVSLTTSPDGQWLIWLDGVLGTINVYGINASTGALTVAAAGSSTAYPTVMNSNISQARAIAVSPNGAYVAVALGNGGDVIYPFTTATGALGTGQEIQFTTTGNTTVSDNAITFDTASAYLYIARGINGAGNSVVASYSINSSGVPGSVATATTGDIPYSVLADSTGKYVYTANRSTGNVSAFSVSNGTFTAITSSPFAAGLTATALVEDNSKTYIISAAFGGSNDYTLFAFDAIAPGKLDALSVGASGTEPAGAIAVAATHYSGSPF